MGWVMYLESLFLGAFVGTAGTMLGGAAAVFFGKRASDPRTFLSFAGGMMVAVVFFDMLAESAEIGGIYIMCGGAVTGAVFFSLISPLISRGDDLSLYSTGILVIIVIAVHNLPEGLAIGSSLARGERFAQSLSLLLLAHNVPEGIAASLPLHLSGVRVKRVLLISGLTGLPTAAGSIIGTALGQISGEMIAACISSAGGAMLYISLKELIPSNRGAKKAQNNKLCAIMGFCTGFFITVLV